MSLLINDETNTSSAPQGLTGPAYWRSLDHLAQTPEFEAMLHREFPSKASEMTSGFSRRAFLGLMAASVSLAGALTGCRRPEEKILPYAKAPENVLPGIPQVYATSAERGGAVQGLLVTNYEGRPTKIEGNPDHPANLGGVDSMTQGAILEMYDPERSTRVLNDGQDSDLESFNKFAEPHFADWRARQGEGLCFLSELTTSPTTLAVRDRLRKALPRVRWHVWEPVNDDNALTGTRLALGRPLRAHYDFSRANVIVSLDADFLTWGTTRLADVRQFARRRRPDEPDTAMNRLYAVEAVTSITGGKADHRLRLPSSRIEAYGLALAAEIAATSPLIPAGSPLAQALAPFRKHDFPKPWIQSVARDMLRSAGSCLVLVGPRQPASLHAVACALDAALGGSCVSYTDLPDAAFGTSGASIKELATAMQAGQVETLVMLGGNPAYDAPADLDFAGLLKQVKTRVHLSLYANETALLSTWHVPRAHLLETWGDTRAADGTISLVQPLIQPLYGGQTDAELLALLGNEPHRRAYDLVRAYHQSSTMGGINFENTWRTALHDGLVKNTALPRLSGIAVTPIPAAIAGALRAIPAASTPVSSAGELELVFLPHPHLYDGRYANNGWLQETSEPVSNLSWDNAALISPQTARKLDLKNTDLVKLELPGGRAAELPIWILPGLADGTVAVHLGYGRKTVGRVGHGVGHDVYPLRALGALDVARGLKISKTGQNYPLSCMQDHWSMEGRPIVRSADYAEYRKRPEFARDAVEHPPLQNLFSKPNAETGYQWGMAIDLDACIGCNACVVACQAENNIPIVGKAGIAQGREMQWLRVDRYFSGTPEDPEMVVQPVPCMHCENAPCEQVCPVAATTHSPEGVNEMTYNRCVGTRYCSNNCPYKVRRFNFFDYTSMKTSVEKMAMNPNVTVRMRGVMEKCNYCIHRVNRTRIVAKNEDRSIRDGEIKTACQQTCPAEAIAFGDVHDPHSLVSKLKARQRNYGMLTEINTQPRTTYLALVRNPNPEMKA